MEFIKKNKTLLILLILSIVCLLFSMGHYANILIDIGREVYYPVEILNGKVLYKDLFCIYGPASYLLNALLIKIFGVKLSVLTGFGFIVTLFVIVFTYKISRRFLSEFYTFSVIFFMIMTGCLATRIFNFTLPYSYAVLYGLLCFLISIYFLIKFKDENNFKNLYIALFLAGFSVSFKYDFILFILPLAYIILKTKNIKTVLKCFSLLFLGFIFPFIVLFFQGLNFNDLISSIQTIKAFTFTSALKTFYVTQGVYYTNRVWGEWLGEILVLGIYFLFIYSGLHLFSRKSFIFKFFGVLLFVFGFNLAYVNAGADSYLFLTFFVTLLFILFFKRNSNLEKIYIISSILISMKSFWGLSHVNYGLYFAPCILISLFIISKNTFSKKITDALCFLIIALSLQYGAGNYFGIKVANYPIKSDKGTIYTLKDMGAPTAEIVDFMNNIKEENPSVMVYPEGLMLNFLSNKKTKTNGFYNSLIPLYIEGFGEDEIIKSYKENPIDYIIFSNILSESYRKGEICKTYAFDVCHYVYQNYSKVFETKSGEEYNYTVFKRN